MIECDCPTEPHRLNEDWCVVVTCYGDAVRIENGRVVERAPFDLIGFAMEVRLIDWFRPSSEPALVASTENGLIEIGDRNEDRSVPMVVRVPAAQVAAALRSNDYRIDLVTSRDGLTDVFSAPEPRHFRS